MKNNSQVNAYCLTSNYLLENHSIYSRHCGTNYTWIDSPYNKTKESVR